MNAPRAAVVLGALMAIPTIPPQGPILDAGTLVISRGGSVVGREEFTVRRGRSSGPEGFTITSTASYPPSSPSVRLSPVVELGPDSIPVQVQFDVHGDGQSRAYAQFGPRRITIRVVHPGGESARELPAVGGEILADDSVFSLHAIPPARGTRHAVMPRSGTRLPAEVAGGGVERTTVQGVPRELRHVVLRIGTQDRHLWYDQDGKLMKVEAPGVSLTAERESR